MKKSEVQHCRYCGGHTKRRIIKHYDIDEGCCVVIINNVPGYECKRCREITYSEPVKRKLNQMISAALENVTDEIMSFEYEK